MILDELGYLPFSATGGALLFQLLSKLYERTSVAITTNLGFSACRGLLTAALFRGRVKRLLAFDGSRSSAMPR